MSPEEDDETDNKDPGDAIESFDEVFDNPNLLDRYLHSIERDLSNSTPPSSNVIGQFKIGRAHV